MVLPPDESRTRGTHVPDVALVDDDSTLFMLSSLAGKPVIVSPIFTTCPVACPAITASLRDALLEIGEPGIGYHVLTISFDPADGPAAMRAYRRQMNLPEGWTLAVASAENLAKLLDAIDFHVQAVPGSGFMHPNTVVVLTPTLVVSSYANGLSFEAKDLRRRLEVATQEASFVRHYRPYIIAISAIAGLSVLLVLYSTRKRKAGWGGRIRTPAN